MNQPLPISSSPSAWQPLVYVPFLLLILLRTMRKIVVFSWLRFMGLSPSSAGERSCVMREWVQPPFPELEGFNSGEFTLSTDCAFLTRQ